MANNVQIPKESIRCSVQKAFEVMREKSKRIVAVLKDEDGNNYAAHSFSPWQLDYERDYSIALPELSEFIEKGHWYVINEDEDVLAESIHEPDYINVYLEGGLVRDVTKSNKETEAFLDLRNHYAESPFNPSEDDATIWKKQPSGAYEIIHNEDSMMDE